MPQPSSYPGVYVEEVPSGVRTISGVDTSITVFIGPTQRGRVNHPVRIRSIADYEAKFGSPAGTLATGHAVRLYFLNGGRDAWVVRVARHPDPGRLQAALDSLESVDLFNLLVLPGITDPASLGLAAAYCRRRRAFLIADAPADARTPAQIEEAVQALALDDASHVAIYYPWIRIAVPPSGGTPLLTPPGGAVAGVFARTDANRGVWKAPAGIEAHLAGVAALAHELTDAENGRLNPRAVNCLRTFPQAAAVIWGARTLAGDDARADEFKYIPVRRTALHLAETIDRGTRWAVFEPNGEPLWAQLRLNIGAFLHTLFRQGAFAGSTPRDAWFVKCDGETTTQTDIDAGRINVLVGFAPLKAAEFVVLRLELTAARAKR